MKVLDINKEWDFITKEIIFSNKGGIRKRNILFEFQLLLPALSWAKSPKEKQILVSFYKKRKERYLMI